MVERFGDAALRHLVTGEALELDGQTDDAAYHFGLVGETALKAASEIALGAALPPELRRHLNDVRKPLQTMIENHAGIIAALANGRVGGALKTHLQSGSLSSRFANWSINIRYHDSNNCPVSPSDLSSWKADAVALYNAGVF